MDDIKAELLTDTLASVFHSKTSFPSATQTPELGDTDEGCDEAP